MEPENELLKQLESKSKPSIGNILIGLAALAGVVTYLLAASTNNLERQILGLFTFSTFAFALSESRRIRDRNQIKGFLKQIAKDRVKSNADSD